MINNSRSPYFDELWEIEYIRCHLHTTRYTLKNMLFYLCVFYYLKHLAGFGIFKLEEDMEVKWFIACVLQMEKLESKKISESLLVRSMINTRMHVSKILFLWLFSLKYSVFPKKRKYKVPPVLFFSIALIAFTYRQKEFFLAISGKQSRLIIRYN